MAGKVNARASRAAHPSSGRSDKRNILLHKKQEHKRAVPSTSVEGTALLVDKYTRFLYIEEMTGKRKLPKA